MSLTEIAIKLRNRAKKQMKGSIGINAIILHLVFEHCTIVLWKRGKGVV